MTNALYAKSFEVMEQTHCLMASLVPPPRPVSIFGSITYRYIEKSLQQALVQKLARLITGLRAICLLNANELHQEQAAIQRIIDELQEDITFLSYAVITNTRNRLHDEYLEDFFQEEFDASTAMASTQLRKTVPRKKIRAYVAHVEGSSDDQKLVAEISRTIYSTYSGYLHAASPQIMEMYYGRPPRWHFGQPQSEPSPFCNDYTADIWNYFYRGLIAFAVSAKALGDDHLFAKVFAHVKEVEKLSGQDYSRKPDHV